MFIHQRGRSNQTIAERHFSLLSQINCFFYDELLTRKTSTFEIAETANSVSLAFR